MQGRERHGRKGEIEGGWEGGRDDASVAREGEARERAKGTGTRGNRDERERIQVGREQVNFIHLNALSHMLTLGGRPSVGNACVKEEKK